MWCTHEWFITSSLLTKLQIVYDTAKRHTVITVQGMKKLSILDTSVSFRDLAH